MKSLIEKINTKKKTGASFVEVAITLPVIMLGLLFLIDISWYFVSYSILAYAVHQGADIASKIPVETDTSSIKCGQSSVDDSSLDQCLRYIKEVKDLLAKVDTTADIITSRGAGSGRAYRYEYQHYYDAAQTFIGKNKDDPNETATSTFSGTYSGLIRPGEKIKRLGGLAGDVVIDHPSRPFATGWPTETESWKSILPTNPIIIAIDAVYQPITPFLPEVSMTLRAFAYRKSGKSNRTPRTYPTWVPNVNFTVAPTAPSPWPPGQPTPTPSGVPSLSPVPTPAINCGCCSNYSCADNSICYACPCTGSCGAG